MTALPQAGAAGEEFVGRCYTKARRTPVVVGGIPGGMGQRLRLPFGPYTLTQLGSAVAVLLVLLLTRPLWGGHGLADAAVLVVIPLGAAFALRHVSVDGRNPLAAAVSIALMLASPRNGRVRGRAWRRPTPRRVTGLVSLASAAPGTERDVDARTARSRRPAATVPGRCPAPAPTKPSTTPVAVGSGSAAVPIRVRSGVQALLAQSTTPSSSPPERLER